MGNLKPSRPIRGESTVDAPVEVAIAIPARGEGTFSKYKPYLGSESLPMPTGSKKLSDPLYEVARSGRRYKLLRYRRGHYGVHRDVVRILEPQNKKRPQDKILLAALKKAGIPGAS